MKLPKIFLVSLCFLSWTLNAAISEEKLSYSTAHMNLSEKRTQVVSLSNLKSLLKQLTLNGDKRPVVRVVRVEGMLTSPPTRGMAQANQGSRLKIKSDSLKMEKLITLLPDTYNQIEVGLNREITAENDISDLLLESESLGMIGDLKLSFIIDYD